MYRQESDSVQTFLAGETQLLELISEGAPLPQILERVCAAIDTQLGTTVSLVLLPDDAEHTLHTFERSAATFGLTPFSCTPILSTEAEFLGTLETYSCFPRTPNHIESALIEQAANLAAVAIEHCNLDVSAESCSLDWNGATRGIPHEKPPLIN